MQISKTMFIRHLARQHKRPQTQYAQALNEILAGLQEQLAQGHSVSFLGFGTFYTREHPSAKITHIRTGKTVTIPAHQRVGFRVGDLLRRAVLPPRKRAHHKRGRFSFLP